MAVCFTHCRPATSCSCSCSCSCSGCCSSSCFFVVVIAVVVVVVVVVFVMLSLWQASEKPKGNRFLNVDPESQERRRHRWVMQQIRKRPAVQRWKETKTRPGSRHKKYYNILKVLVSSPGQSFPRVLTSPYTRIVSRGSAGCLSPARSPVLSSIGIWGLLFLGPRMRIPEPKPKKAWCRKKIQSANCIY